MTEKKEDSGQILTFSAAEEYLYSLVSYERFGLKKYGQQSFSMSLFRHLMEMLNHPERRMRAIHVAGTDGKGSTCQYLTSILHQAGYSVGTYTSPHLEHVRQRIQICCQPVSEEEFARAVAEIRPLLDSIPESLPEGTPDWEKKKPSFFEAITAVAFKVFAEKDLDFSIVEVGLGGRLDATNVVDPLASILTPLDLEHTEFLGSTIESIAREKAGIAKKGRPFVIGPQDEKISVLLHDECLKVGAIPCHAEMIKNTRILSRDITGYKFFFGFRWKKIDDGSYLLEETNKGLELRTPLLGDHQVQNAALCLSCLNLLQEQERLDPLRKEILAAGLSETVWPARTEPFIDERTGATVIVDGAHTVQAMRTLRRTIDQLFPDKPVCFILGFLEGKRISESVNELVREDDYLLCVKPSSARAITVEALSEEARKVLPGAVKSFEDTGEALKEARRSGRLVVIAGSIYLAGEMRKRILGQQNYRPVRE